ncbi:elongation factor P [Nitrospira sp. Kam-Ns4a]
MRPAQDLREGHAILLNGELYRVLSVTLHSGTGQFAGSVRATLRHLRTGREREQRWAMDDRVEDVALERVKMQFLYSDQDEVVFMHPETFDQVSLSRAALEKVLPFLKEGDSIQVECYEGKPVSVDMPRAVEVTVASCGTGIRGQGENTMKDATLDNGMVILVPQFIQPGDRILVEVETCKYLDRMRKEGKRAPEGRKAS